MKRFVKRWAIRLLGRELAKLSWKQWLLLIWSGTAFLMMIGLRDDTPLWLQVLVLVNVALSVWRVYPVLREVDDPSI